MKIFPAKGKNFSRNLPDFQSGSIGILFEK
jgi:hypothetical protein